MKFYFYQLIDLKEIKQNAQEKVKSRVINLLILMV